MDERGDTAMLSHGRSAGRTTNSVAKLLSWIVADEDEESTQNSVDNVICIDDEDEDEDGIDLEGVINVIDYENEEIDVEDVDDQEREAEAGVLSIVNFSIAEPSSSTSFEHKCEHCCQTFEKEEGLYEHLLSEHDDDDDDDDMETYECHICHKICGTKITLDKHRRSHQVKKMYECYICNKRWKTRLWSLQLHMKTVHGDNVKFKRNPQSKIRWSHTCPTCGLHFKCMKSLNEHSLIHGEQKLSESAEMATRTGAAASESSMKESGPQESAEKEPSILSSAKTRPRAGMKGHLYECDFCGKTVKTLWRLRDHRRKHTGTDLYRCETCNIGFSRLAEWCEHNKIHYACQHCELRFSYQNMLDNHVRTVHMKEKNICDICGKGVFNVRVHQATAHKPKPNRQFMCQICFRWVKTEKDIEYHKSFHDNNGSCPECGRRLNTVYHYKLHLQNHDISSHDLMHRDKSHSCDICSKSYRFPRELRVHRVAVHERARNHQCEYCGKAYYYQANVRKHKLETGCGKSDHTENAGGNEIPGNHQCTYCGKLFRFELNMLKHQQRTGCGLDGKPYNNQCEHCGRTFAFPSFLKSHLTRCEKSGNSRKARREKEKPRKKLVRKLTGPRYRCETCDLSFKYRKELAEHNKIHYVCQNCELRFSSQSFLDRHVRTVHDREKGICDICGGQFFDVPDHKARVHEPKTDQFQCQTCLRWVKTEKDIEFHNAYHENKGMCPECGKKFETPSLFKFHLQNHDTMHRERPYLCDICSKSYRFPRELREHQHAVHERARNYQCEHCGKAYYYPANVRYHKQRTGCGQNGGKTKSACRGKKKSKKM